MKTLLLLVAIVMAVEAIPTPFRRSGQQIQAQAQQRMGMCFPPDVIPCDGRGCDQCGPHERCCVGSCGQFTCTNFFQNKLEMAQAQQQIGVCFPPNMVPCDGHGCDECGPHERCCDGSCGQPTCTNMFQNKLEMAQMLQISALCSPPPHCESGQSGSCAECSMFEICCPGTCGQPTCKSIFQQEGGGV